MDDFDLKLKLLSVKLHTIVDHYKEVNKGGESPIHLFFSYYRDNHPDRRKEIELCLKLNTQNQLFSKIFILNETNQEIDFIQPSERIIVVSSPRLTFNKLFKFINTQVAGTQVAGTQVAGTQVADQTINILINTDTVIGENFNQIQIGHNQVICLSRYDFNENGQEHVCVGGGSHDCWIWKGHIKESFGRFYMGQFLCDGVLAHELSTCGYQLKNPMLDLKIYHVHISNVRNYSYDNCILGHRNGVNFSHNNGVFNTSDVYYEGLNYK